MPDDAGAEKAEYEVSLTGPGMTLKRSVVREVADKILMFVMTGRAAGGKDVGASLGEPGADAEIETDTAAELARKHGANSNLKRVVVLGVHFKQEGKQTFTSSDIRDGFPMIGEGPPTNPTRDLKETVKKGWIAPAPGHQGAFFVTRSGQEALKANFKASRKGRRGRKPSARKEMATKTK